MYDTKLKRAFDIRIFFRNGFPLCFSAYRLHRRRVGPFRADYHIIVDVPWSGSGQSSLDPSSRIRRVGDDHGAGNDHHHYNQVRDVKPSIRSYQMAYRQLRYSSHQSDIVSSSPNEAL